MNEIIQNLEANATNGYEQFCYIDEKMLEAMKELAKRENEEKVKLEHNWNELKKWLEDEYEKLHGAIYSTNAVFLRNDDLLIKMDTVNKILNKISELEEGGNNEDN